MLSTPSRSAVTSFAAFLALSIAWMATIPLFAGPDEPANFIKAAAVVRGELVGESIPPSVSTSFWSTYVDIDPRFGTAQLVPWCFVGQPQTPACDAPLETLSPVEPARTDMGRYPPFGFVPAGVGTFFGPSDWGVRGARLTLALACCGLLTLAAELLRRRDRSLVPLLAAATPGVIFLSSVTSPSGLEVTAAIAAWSALWLGIDERWKRTSTFVTFIGTASLLVVTRPAGIVSLAVMAAVALMADARPWFDALRRRWHHPVVLVSACAVSLIWYVAVYSHNTGVDLDVESRVSDVGTIVSRSFADLPRLIGESIGNFGWLDTPSPAFVVWGFVAIVAGLGWRTVRTSNPRRRAALAIAVVGVPMWHLALNINYQDLLGTFGAQGRHLTPLIVGIPLAATMHRRTALVDSMLTTIILFLHAWCVLAALRRYATGSVGDDLFGFVRQPEWTPPLGIGLTLLVIAVTHVVAWLALRPARATPRSSVGG